MLDRAVHVKFTASLPMQGALPPDPQGPCRLCQQCAVPGLLQPPQHMLS